MRGGQDDVLSDDAGAAIAGAFAASVVQDHDDIGLEFRRQLGGSNQGKDGRRQKQTCKASQERSKTHPPGCC